MNSLCNIPAGLRTCFILGSLLSAGQTALAGTEIPSQRASAKQSLVSEYVGHYYLSGVRDVGAELRLKPDGQFAYQMSYGAVDRSATGRWIVDGSRITLMTSPKDPPGLKLGSVSDVVKSPYSDPGEKKTILVVEVISPNLGMVWSNVQVTAEFSNQKQRSGLTGRNGMLGFDQRDDEEWKGATVKRVRVEYPRVKGDTGWIDVDASLTRTLTVYFEPGDLISPPFKELQLDAVRSESGGLSLIGVQEDGESISGVKFTR